MSRPLAGWPRPDHDPDGGAPSVFLVVYAPLPDDWTIQRRAYRTDGVPAGVDMVTYGPDAHPEVVASFRAGPFWKRFQADRPQDAAAARGTHSCVVLRGAPPDDGTLDWLRDLTGLVQWLFDRGGTAVFDAQSLQWRGRDSWRSLWEAEEAGLSRHVAICVSAEGGRERVRTRGMRTFGRPDIDILGVEPSRRPVAVELARRLIRLQIRGATIADGQPLWFQGVPGGMVAHRDDAGDPDAEDAPIRIDWAEEPVTPPAAAGR